MFLLMLISIWWQVASSKVNPTQIHPATSHLSQLGCSCRFMVWWSATNVNHIPNRIPAFCHYLNFIQSLRKIYRPNNSSFIHEFRFQMPILLLKEVKSMTLKVLEKHPFPPILTILIHFGCDIHIIHQLHLGAFSTCCWPLYAQCTFSIYTGRFWCSVPLDLFTYICILNVSVHSFHNRFSRLLADISQRRKGSFMEEESIYLKKKLQKR